MSIDHDILEAIRNNKNQQVLKELYNSVLPKVTNYILKNNGNIEDAKDVFQDAVISFFRSVKTNRFNEEYEIGGYLFSIARNAWINKARKHQKESIVAEVPEKGSTTNQLESLISNERAQIVQQTMAKLGEQCQELMKLTMYENRPPREITTMMGFSSVEVTRTNLYRCRKKLTELILKNKNILSTK